MDDLTNKATESNPVINPPSPEPTPNNTNTMESTIPVNPTPTQSTQQVQTPQPTPAPQAEALLNQPSQPGKKGFSFAIPAIIIIIILLLVGGLFWVKNSFQLELKKNVTTKTEQPTQQLTTLQSVLKSGVVVIGSDTTYPPMESVDAKGNFVGYDIDLGNRIGQELGVKAQFKTIPFDDIFNQLVEKKYDIVISSITITDERKQKYAFSDPYLNAGEVIITRKTNTLVKGPTDLAGKKVGVQINTTEAIEAPKYTSQNLVISYPDNAPAIVDLNAGKIDAVLTDLPNAKGIIDSNPGLKIASDPFTNDVYGVVFRKEDVDFVEKVNQILTTLQENGYLTDLKHKWLE